MNSKPFVDEFARFLIALPVLVPEASLVSWTPDTDEKYTSLVDRLNGDAGSISHGRFWTLQPFEQHPSHATLSLASHPVRPIEVPAAVKARRSGVLLCNLPPSPQLLLDAENALHAAGLHLETLALRAIVWERGLAQIDIEIVARLSHFSSLSIILEPLEDLWNRHFEALRETESDFLGGWPEQLAREADRLGLRTRPDHLLTARVDTKRRLPTYSMNLLLQQAPTGVSVTAEDFQRVLDGFVGRPAEVHDTSPSDPVLYSAAGYEGQLVIVRSEQYTAAAQWLWRVVTLRWAVMSEAKSEASAYLAKLPDRTFGTRSLSREMINLRRTRGYLEMVQEETDEDSLADDNFERAITIPVWKAWNGAGLANALRRHLAQIDAMLGAMSDELTQRQQSKLNRWLALLAAIQGAAAFPVVTGILSEVGVLSIKAGQAIAIGGISVLILVGIFIGARSFFDN